MAKNPFEPQSASIRAFHNPWGELCYEQFRFAMKNPKGGGQWKQWTETHSDLLPQGGTFLVFETEESCWWWKIAARSPGGGA